MAFLLHFTPFFRVVKGGTHFFRRAIYASIKWNESDGVYALHTPLPEHVFLRCPRRPRMEPTHSGRFEQFIKVFREHSHFPGRALAVTGKYGVQS